jgi:hypothetical protein
MKLERYIYLLSEKIKERGLMEDQEAEGRIKVNRYLNAIIIIIIIIILEQIYHCGKSPYKC